MCSLGYSCMYDFTGKMLCQCLAEGKVIPPPLFSFCSHFLKCIWPAVFIHCNNACVGVCMCLSSSLPRSCSVTMQPVQNNMDTTVAEWPFWVKALCNNKQLLAERSCFPAADRCQNTELTAIPFTAVEKHQPSKPTYLLRLWTACNPSAARWLSETSQPRLLPKKLLHSYSVTFI